MTLSPSRRDSELEDPTLSKQPGEKQHKVTPVRSPKTMDGHDRGPWTLTRAPQPGSRASGDLALAPRSCCPSDSCGHPHPKAAERLGGVTGGNAKPLARRGEMRRHIQREPLPSSPRQGQGREVRCHFLRAKPGVW